MIHAYFAKDVITKDVMQLQIACGSILVGDPPSGNSSVKALLFASICVNGFRLPPAIKRPLTASKGLGLPSPEGVAPNAASCSNA